MAWRKEGGREAQMVREKRSACLSFEYLPFAAAVSFAHHSHTVGQPNAGYRDPILISGIDNQHARLISKMTSTHRRAGATQNYLISDHRPSLPF